MRHWSSDAGYSMYYHFAILLLFRPLIKLRIIGSSITPRDVCLQAADAITGLLRSYAQLYTLRLTPSFVPYFVLTSSIMHLSIAATGSSAPPLLSSDAARGGRSALVPAKLDTRVTEALSRGIADLTEIAPCHHFAEQALNILKFLAKKWKIDNGMTTDVGDKYREAALPDPDQATRPEATSLNFFALNFLESDFNCTWGGDGAASGAGPDSRPGASRPSDAKEVAAAALGNPLFWPFPMQGRPMFLVGKELEEAGFEMI